ncbi:hypothetical protein QYE76_011072 [Lolium multiflorum]|uniref:CCHC-type domain-containing protein n=1 Tax=Lolium multiflorum TaxID=4521 RepID=A0AAD8TUN8_LOLMU|nr:hypothetical protein QYE76_011072 [Lolium multiflorum]
MTSVLWYNNNHNNHLMKMAVSMVTMRMLLLLKAWDVVLVVVFHVASIAVLLKLEPAVFLHSRKTMVWQGVMTVDAYYMEMEMLMQRARVRESLEMTMQRFLNGLKFNIKGIVRHHSYTTMNELLHHAREAESQLAEEAQQRGRATGAGRYTPRPPPSTAPSTRPTDVPSSSSKPVSNVSNTKRPVPAASGTGSSMSTARNRDMLCHTCGGKGHFKKDCPNRKVMIINEDNEYETGDDADPDAPEDDDYDSDSFDAYPSEAQTIVVSQRVLNVQPSASTQRCNLFQTKALVGPDKACKVIIDGGSCRNLASKELCAKLKLKYLPHPHPYYIQWLSNNGEMKVSHMVRVDFEIGPKAVRAIFSEFDETKTKHLNSPRRTRTPKGRRRGGPGPHTTGPRGQAPGRAGLWEGTLVPLRRRLFAYKVPRDLKTRDRLTKLQKDSRDAAAIAKLRFGEQKSVPAPCRDGELPPEPSPSTPPPSSSPLLSPMMRRE